MSALAYNLKTLMSDAKVNASELARLTGVAQPIIYRLYTGENKNPKLNTLKPLCRYFMVNLSELVGELPLPTDKSFYRKGGEHRGWSRVPLISWQDAIDWPDPMETYQDSQDSIFVATDANVSKLAYSLKINGSAMEPLFPAGTTIIVEPNRSPQDRDFVVVQINGESEARLKQILLDGKDRYLKSLNPDLEKMRVVPLTQEDKFLGVMAQAKVDY